MMYCGREASCAVLYLRLAKKVRNTEAEWEKITYCILLHFALVVRAYFNRWKTQLLSQY